MKAKKERKRKVKPATGPTMVGKPKRPWRAGERVQIVRKIPKTTGNVR